MPLRLPRELTPAGMMPSLSLALQKAPPSKPPSALVVLLTPKEGNVQDLYPQIWAAYLKRLVSNHPKTFLQSSTLLNHREAVLRVRPRITFCTKQPFLPPCTLLLHFGDLRSAWNNLLNKLQWIKVKHDRLTCLSWHETSIWGLSRAVLLTGSREMFAEKHKLISKWWNLFFFFFFFPKYQHKNF